MFISKSSARKESAENTLRREQSHPIVGVCCHGEAIADRSCLGRNNNMLPSGLL